MLWSCLLLSAHLGAAEWAADQAVDQVADRAGDEVEVLQPITVQGKRIANLQPASSYAALVSGLRFDPQIDVQARGLPEGQADITVRGGQFENTGFRLGAVTIFDPQTGHYAVEVPIAPVILSPPELLTDLDHGLGAFNASVATIRYGFNRINNGGSFDIGFGNDRLRSVTIQIADGVSLEQGMVDAERVLRREHRILPGERNDFRCKRAMRGYTHCLAPNL